MKTDEELYEGTDPSQTPDGEDVVGALFGVAYSIVHIAWTIIERMVTMVYQAIRR